MVDIPDNENWLPVGEAASLLGKSARTLRRWVTAGKLPSEERGGRLWVEVSEYVPRDTTLDDLKSEVDILRAEVKRLSDLLDQVSGERDRLWSQVQFQNSQIATLQRLKEHEAIEPPGKRSWWPPWKSGD